MDEKPDAAVARIEAAGYDGLEIPLIWIKRPDFDDYVSSHRLKYIVDLFAQGDSPEEQIDSLKAQVEEALRLKPAMLSAHTGKDSWSLGDSVRFYTEAARFEKGVPVRIAHETHRGRSFFNPWTTRDILKEVPAIRLNADLSHWVCVCERLLDGETEVLDLCARHSIHIHARVGHTQGPQVADPRAPEALPFVEAHEKWWDMIWDTQAARGEEISALTPEFGPAPYQQLLPYTGMPVADNWDICVWQMERQRRRFARRFGA